MFFLHRLYIAYAPQVRWNYNGPPISRFNEGGVGLSRDAEESIKEDQRRLQKQGRNQAPPAIQRTADRQRDSRGGGQKEVPNSEVSMKHKFNKFSEELKKRQAAALGGNRDVNNARPLNLDGWTFDKDDSVLGNVGEDRKQV